MPSTVDHVAQVSDAGISGTRPYTGNYPTVILATLRKRHALDGLDTEGVGIGIGAHFDGRWDKGQEFEVLDALGHLENLGLVERIGKLWIAKKVGV